MNYFVTAIGTDSGKTVVSAILTQALPGNYWKPIQAGEPRDLNAVKEWVSNPDCWFFEETYLLKMPASPHYAARLERLKITTTDFVMPHSSRVLVIEGAGGLMVPINDQEHVIDLIPHFNAEVILVSDLYLGSINHTLLSIDALQKRSLGVKGIIFNRFDGSAYHDDCINTILNYSGYSNLLVISNEDQINAGVIKKYADKLALIFKDG